MEESSSDATLGTEDLTFANGTAFLFAISGPAGRQKFIE
jgi:hypothetical protein